MNSIYENNISNKKVLNTLLKYLEKKEDGGKHHLLGYLSKKNTIDELITESKKNKIDINKNTEIWGIKCTKISDKSEYIEIIDKSATRESYANFVFALYQGLIDVNNIINRNKIFNQVRYIMNDWYNIFGSRFIHHTIEAVKKSKVFFTKKQKKQLSINIDNYIVNDSDSDNDDYPIDYIDEIEKSKPFICPECCENPPSNYPPYLCNKCDREERECFSSYYDNIMSYQCME